VRFSFGDYELDLDARELRAGADVVALEPQVFSVLTYLLQHRDRVVPKEELLDEIWGDRFVSESALTSRIKSVRQAVGDDGTTQAVIRTIHGVGYRFVADATEVGRGSITTGSTSGAPYTFLFTDVEQSSSAWNRDTRAMADAMVVHDTLLESCIAAAGGVVFKHTGDGVCAVFSSPVNAVEAALAVQAAFKDCEWPGPTLRVRIGLHLGEAIERDGDFFGPMVNKTARITDAAHGGQIVASASVVESSRELLGDHVTIVDEGWFPLDDFGETNLFQIGPVVQDRPRPLRARRQTGVILHEPRKSLVGREAEAEHLQALLRDSRLVTLVGPAGVGKTHLALHVAPRAGEDRGAILVELAKIRDERAVGTAVLAAIGAVEQPGTDAVESACRALEHRDGLLVLDNCEHVHASAAALCSALLDRCRDLTVLATSRQRLGVSGERLVTLQPLERKAAIEIFVERAGALGAHVDRSDPVLARVCDRLDRIPLAIELASAHTRVLALDDLERLLDDRLRLLESPAGHDVDHHRTLEAAISWSYSDLDRDERQTLDRLTVFAGSFDLAAAEAVVAESADAGADVVRRLLDLCERSLVVPPGPESGPGRYRLLESIRLFGDSQLDDRDEVRRRHVAHFVARIEEAIAVADAAVLDDQIRLLDVDWHNLRAALEYADELGDAESMLRIVNAVAFFAELTQNFEVVEWCGRAFAHDVKGVPDDVVRDALANHARLLAHRNELDRAGELAAEAEKYGSSPAVSMARYWREWTSGEFAAAAAALDTLDEQTAGWGDLYEVSGIVLRYFLQVAAGMDAGGRLRRLEQIATSGSDIVDAMLALAYVLDEWTSPDRVAILEHLERAHVLAERNGLHVLMGGVTTLRSLALAFDDGDDRSTTRAVRDGLRHYLDSGMWTTTMAVLPVAARMLNRAGNPRVAATLLGVRVASRYQGGVSGDLIADEKARCQSELGDEFDELYALGTKLGAPEAARLAIDALDEALRVSDSTESCDRTETA
jgi:predicted ATPase/class 3 adenylate cyclase